MAESQNYRLMERDIQVILDVYKHRYLSVSQIMGGAVFVNHKITHRDNEKVTHFSR